MIFKAIAILEMATFYACYFFEMIAQKKKGIQTDQMGKGKEGVVKFIEITRKVVTFIVPAVEITSTAIPLASRCVGERKDRIS